MRSLQTKDIFSLSRIIMSLGLKDEFKKIAEKANTNDINAVGYEMFFTIISKCTDEKTEEKIYEFLAGPLEVEVNEIANMDIFVLADKVIQIADVNKWKLFFSRASQLIK